MMGVFVLFFFYSNRTRDFIFGTVMIGSCWDVITETVHITKKKEYDVDVSFIVNQQLEMCSGAQTSHIFR